MPDTRGCSGNLELFAINTGYLFFVDSINGYVIILGIEVWKIDGAVYEINIQIVWVAHILSNGNLGLISRLKS